MNELPSTEFRKRFARLTEPTVVTVNGHAIGRWLPTGADFFTATNAYDTPEQVRASGWSKAPAAQAQRDDLLRKINR